MILKCIVPRNKNGWKLALSATLKAFKATRMKICFKDVNNKMQLVHTLNGQFACIAAHELPCLLENHQTENNIHLPEALHKYFGSPSIS